MLTIFTNNRFSLRLPWKSKNCELTHDGFIIWLCCYYIICLFIYCIASLNTLFIGNVNLLTAGTEWTDVINCCLYLTKLWIIWLFLLVFAPYNWILRNFSYCFAWQTFVTPVLWYLIQHDCVWCEYCSKCMDHVFPGNSNNNLIYEDGKLLLVYSDGKTNCNGVNNRTTTIIFTCHYTQPESNGPRFLASQSTECSYFFEWQTSLACIPFESVTIFCQSCLRK